MIHGQRKIRGIRDKIKPGQLIGKGIGSINTRGHAHPLTPAEAKAFLRFVADEISNTSTLTGNSVADALTGIASTLLSAIPDGDLLSNISGGSTIPIGNTLTAILDHVLGSAQGDIIYRDSGVWKVLAPGTNGQFLQTQGAAANPQWAATSGLPSVADGDLLANTSGGAALPVATTLSALIDYVLGSARGDILYRGSSAWTVLAPGTTGFALITGGAGADPSWSGATGISGSVTTHTPSIIQSANASGAGTPNTATVSFTSTPVVGNLLVFYIGGHTDSLSLAGGTTLLPNGSSANNQQVQIAYRRVQSGDGKNWAFGMNTGVTSVYGIEVHDASSIISNSAVATGLGNTSLAIPFFQAPEVSSLFLVMVEQDSAPTTIAAASGWTQTAITSAGNHPIWIYQRNTALGANDGNLGHCYTATGQPAAGTAIMLGLIVGTIY